MTIKTARRASLEFVCVFGQDGNAALAHAEALLREITDEIKFQFLQSPLGLKLRQVHYINQSRTVQGELPLCIP